MISSVTLSRETTNLPQIYPGFVAGLAGVWLAGF